MIFCSPFFAEYFIKPNIFFNTYSLFYGGYQFHFNQANWDHQDEVLVPCSSRWLSNRNNDISTIHIPNSSRPLFFGAVIDRISYSNHYKNYSVLVPSFTGWLSNGADRVYIAVLIGFSSPVLRGGYRILSYQQLKKQTKVLVPLFYGVVVVD